MRIVIPLEEQLEWMLIVMLAQHWFAKWSAKFGFPKDYLVIDIETTGFDRASDLIVQIGHCLVKDAQVVENKAYLLDWTSRPDIIQQEDLCQRLAKAKKGIETGKDGKPTGEQYPFSYYRLKTEGHPPDQVLNQYYEMITSAKASKQPIVGHNCWSFDYGFLRNHMSAFLKKDLLLAGNDMLDTGVMVKASQLQEISKFEDRDGGDCGITISPKIVSGGQTVINRGYSSLPQDADTLQSWSIRIRDVIARGVYWSLGRYCIKKYDLINRFNVDPAKAHDASYDALLTHYLLETFRELAEIGFPVPKEA